MKFRLATALALSLAFTQLAAPAAYAEQASSFRTVAPQTFSTEEIQAFGLSSSDTAQVIALQDQGYQVVVLSPEEAAQYQAGMTSSGWIFVGAIVIVALIGMQVAG